MASVAPLPAALAAAGGVALDAPGGMVEALAPGSPLLVLTLLAGSFVFAAVLVDVPVPVAEAGAAESLSLDCDASLCALQPPTSKPSTAAR